MKITTIIITFLLAVASCAAQDITKWPKHTAEGQTNYMASYRAFHGKRRPINRPAAFALMEKAAMDTNHINARMAYACFLRYGVACKADREKGEKIIGEVAELVKYPKEAMLDPEYDPKKLLVPGATVNPFNISELMLKRGYQAWNAEEFKRQIRDYNAGTTPPFKKPEKK